MSVVHLYGFLGKLYSGFFESIFSFGLVFEIELYEFIIYFNINPLSDI